MKNTQIKGVFIGILISILSTILTFFSMKEGQNALAFLCIFAAFSSIVIALLFSLRSLCMSKMLRGTDLIASWQYTKEETQGQIEGMKNENKGIFVMAIPFFSFVGVIVSLFVGFASRNPGMGILIALFLIVFNIVLFQIFLRIKPNPQKSYPLRPSDYKKSFVYISSSGIYANGMLHMWKGWGSQLKEVHHDEGFQTLSFTYSYLRPYGLGRYTVLVQIPNEKMILENIREKLLTDNRIFHNL